MSGEWYPITDDVPVASRYAYHQSVPAASWFIEHNLNTKPPLVLVLDEAPNEQVYTDVTYLDETTAVVSWPSPVAGWAYA